MTIGLVALMTRVSVTLHHAASSINYVMFFAALFKKKLFSLLLCIRTYVLRIRCKRAYKVVQRCIKRSEYGIYDG